MREKINFYNHCIYYGLRQACNFFIVLTFNFLSRKASSMVTKVALKSLWERCRDFGTLQITSLLPFFFSNVLVF